MTPTEALALVRIVRAACPSQKLDEFTPDVWHGLLEDLLFDDCRAAVMAVAKRQPFVSPSEIRTEVRRIRTERIDANTDISFSTQARMAHGDGVVCRAAGAGLRCAVNMLASVMGKCLAAIINPIDTEWESGYFLGLDEFF